MLIFQISLALPSTVLSIMTGLAGLEKILCLIQSNILPQDRAEVVNKQHNLIKNCDIWK